MAGDARSGIVRFLKLALPLAAAGLVVAVFLSPRPEVGAGIGFSGVSYDATDGLRLSDPRFTGRTREGQPFVVTAAWALPDGPDPETVTLGPLRGEIAVDDARLLVITADGGEMLPKRNRLRLDDVVKLESSDGYALTTGQARIDIEAETLEAEGPVSGAGPAGLIEAGSLRAARRGESHYIWFENRVRVRIDPSRARDGRSGRD